MDDKNFISRGCNSRFYSDRGVDSDFRPIKSIEYLSKISRAALIAMLPWNVYAEAEQFPGVPPDGFVNSAAFVDSPSAAVSSPELIPVQAEMIAPEGASPAVNAGGVNPQRDAVNQKLASLEVVGAGVLNQVLNPQPTPIAPLEKASLEVVDTGTSRQVQMKPQPVDTWSGAASEEITHLPYAVLLAILALMSMVPVARRKD